MVLSGASSSSGNLMFNFSSIYPAISRAVMELIPVSPSVLSIFRVAPACSGAASSRASLIKLKISSSVTIFLLSWERRHPCLPLNGAGKDACAPRSIDAAQNDLRQRLESFFKHTHASRQITLVIVEGLIPPSLPDQRFIPPQIAQPGGRGPGVMLAPRPELHDFPVRIDRGHDGFRPWRDRAGKDNAGSPGEVSHVFALTRKERSDHALQAEPRAGVGPFPGAAKIIAIDSDVLFTANLLRSGYVLEHSDADHGVESLLRLVLEVGNQFSRDSRRRPFFDRQILSLGERDPGHILDPHLEGQEFHQSAPPTSDVEHALFGRHSDLVVKPSEFVELGLIQIIRPLEEGAGVYHPPVEPEAEEVVRNIVCDGN